MHDDAPFVTAAPTALPRAVMRPRRRGSWVWLLPVGALVFAVWLGLNAWSMRGIAITVQLDNGYGLKSGDDVRFRGIAVGKIDEIAVAPDLNGILVKARLTSQAESLARSGSRFWVVRPQVELTRIQGLETLVGPRFLAVIPAAHRPGETPRRQRNFVGLFEPPIVESIEPGDLEVVLVAAQRGSLHAGAPISYRQTQVGTILSVGLSGDGSRIEARAHIQQPYVPLIRPNTRFWDVGGIQARVGLTGLSIDVESAKALLTGGVALATPPAKDAGGEIVRTGHRFTLAPKSEKDWLEWEPMVAIGSSLLPPGVAPPAPLRARISWTQPLVGGVDVGWMSRDKSRNGWVLKTDKGLLGPADLFKADDKAEPQSVLLEVGGAAVPLNAQSMIWEHNGIAYINGTVSGTMWPAKAIRRPSEPEECLAISDAGTTPLPLAALRLTPQSEGNSWQIDPAVSIDQSWHGACVIARIDGRLVGLLLVDDTGLASVALMPKMP